MTTSRSEREHPQQPVCATASPFDAAVQQESEPIVLEVAEAVPDALDLLDQQVHGFGGSVGQAGAVPAEDLVLPPPDGGGEAAELGDVGTPAVDVEALEPPSSLALRAGGVYLPQQLLGEVGGADLAGGVAGVEPGLNASPPSLGQPFVSDEQLAADPVQRLTLASPVAEGVLLHPAADLVQGGVAQSHGVEVIDDQLGVGQPLGQAPGVAGVGIQGDGVDGGQPRRRPGDEPPGNPLRSTAFDHIEEPVAVQVDEAGHQQRRVLRVGGEEGVLVEPQRRRGAEAGQVIHPRSAVIAHRGQGGVPPHPEAPGHLGDGVAGLTDEAADLGSGPLGQRRPRGDLIHLL
jgi:hypothetical protein